MSLLDNLRKQLILAKRMAQHADSDAERDRLFDAIIKLEGAIIGLEQIRIEIAEERTIRK